MMFFLGGAEMKTAMLSFLALSISLGCASRVFAKAPTTKIIISGSDLRRPIEISDPAILTNFRVWTGPGTSSNDKQGLIVDWFQGPLQEPRGLRRYQVSFYAGAVPNERLVYVVYYAFSPGADPGYVYLPGGSDEWGKLNVRSVFRGVEGKWFRAWSAWESVARPLIEKGT